MARLISFFDGAQSGTTPTIGNIVASSLVTYTDDATFEANEQGAPTEGNIYFNTTDNVIRYYNGTKWISIVDEETSQTLQNKTIDGTDATGNNTVSIDASDASYDNSTSGLSATDSQAAIDEVESRVDTNETNIATNTSNIQDNENAIGAGGFADMGSYTAGSNGFNLTSGESAKENIQELIDGVDSRQLLSEKNQANGYAGLNGSGKLSTSVLPASVMQYRGSWDANTNTPTLTDGVGDTGDVYRVTVAGTQDLGSGSNSYDIGDWISYDGSVWQKQDNIDQVTEVNSQTGVVSLDTDDIPEGVSNEYYTDAKVDARIASSSIDDLSDVDTTTTPPNDGDSLTWNNANSEWEPSAISTGATQIDDLTDVDTSTVAPTEGQALLWNNTDSEWQPGDVLQQVDPTQQIFTSGSGTYNLPADVKWIRVKMIGGGGGGQGSGNGDGGAGSDGGNTTFGTSLLTANGGSGATFNGGAGGSTSIAAGPSGYGITGGSGQARQDQGTSLNVNGGDGGNGFFGGAGGGSVISAGKVGTSNTGGGGGGAGQGSGSAGQSGAGGGAGGFIEAIITNPNSSYSYSVGSGGAGGSAGTNGNAGGTGGSGIIIVEEYYV